MKSYKSNIRISAKVPVNSAKNMADGSWRDELLGKVYGLTAPNVTPQDMSIKLSKLLSIESAAKEVIDRSERLYSGETWVDVYGAIKDLKKAVES